MPTTIGQFVQYVKANLSKCYHRPEMRQSGMAQTDDEALFNDRYCARLRRLRDEMGWTAEQMAIRLGIPADRYRKYEVRSPMPPYLISRFAALVDRSIAFILTGTDDVPLPQVVTPHRKRA